MPLLLMSFLSACNSVPVDTYVSERPYFEPRVFFDGEIDAWGVVYDWRGRVKRRFVVDILARADNDEITLDEKFLFSDGEASTRVWRITVSSDNAITARADDVVGEASGEIAGNAMGLSYVIDLPVGDRQFRVRFDDMLWQIDDDVVFNRAKISKFGLKVGEVMLFMKKRNKDSSH